MNVSVKQFCLLFSTESNSKRKEKVFTYLKLLGETKCFKSIKHVTIDTK